MQEMENEPFSPDFGQEPSVSAAPSGSHVLAKQLEQISMNPVTTVNDSHTYMQKSYF